MKKCGYIALMGLLLCGVSCQEYSNIYSIPEPVTNNPLTLKGVAKILSELPLGEEHLDEVFDAVNSSSGNGYDEEYMMSDLFTCPGAGVGSDGTSTKAGGYATPLKDLFAEYFEERYGTKSGEDVLRYLEELQESDMQIYWPYSENWNGEDFPIVTFDPGYDADSNYGYEIRVDDRGVRVVDSVYVDEAVAARRPVWVINRNDDSAFSPLEIFKDRIGPASVPSGDVCSQPSPEGGERRQLLVKSFRMLRNYDSWFGGASEFFIKAGSVDGFKATKDEDLKLYTPSVTDFMIVVKRNQLKKDVELDCLVLTDFTDQIDKIAFLVIEDDGGTTTSWKCSASVKYNSKAYGFELEIPYKDKDDVVWRGQLSGDYLRENPQVSSRFGDVIINFETR